ncbi:unnamed protein product [Ilex paraguariensis]|uniref:Uncharacterized protein n=1 Tax=Ilex paraguariensis TaxID=185542 RepID=A0ABC8U6M8_9AQUA
MGEPREVRELGAHSGAVLGESADHEAVVRRAGGGVANSAEPRRASGRAKEADEQSLHARVIGGCASQVAGELPGLCAYSGSPGGQISARGVAQAPIGIDLSSPGE